MTSDYGLVFFTPTSSSKIKRLQFRNGVYEGETNKEKRHGVGIMIFENGLAYFGEWADDHAHGQGNLLLPVGYVLRGTFQSGVLTQNAFMTSPVSLL